ncbi:MAG: zeta toxin family protein [Streptosporangiaceae bacterium]
MSVIWNPDRSRHQGRVVDGLCRQVAVPAERKAVLAGGLRGADKAAALSKAGLDRGRYLNVSVDAVLAEMARRSLIPVVAGLAPLEAAGLVHAEAQHVAKRLAARAMAAGANVLLDVTAASWPSVRSWLHVADRAAYTLDVVIADLSAADAVRWAAADHDRGQAAYRAGTGDGGRSVPPAAIRAAADLVTAAGQLPWARHIAHLNRRRPIAFPGGEVADLINAYRNGELTLDGLTRLFRDRPWPVTPPTCPADMPAAALAIDDLEPWQPGSFDEVVLACDLGILEEGDYATITYVIGANSAAAG